VGVAVARRSTSRSTCSVLLDDIEAFLCFTGIRPGTFGRLALNDVNLMFKLGQGQQLSDDAVNRVRLFMQGYEDAKS